MKKFLLVALALMMGMTSSFAQIGGYFTPVYGEDYGFGPYTDTNEAVANIRTLLNNYPRAGAAPVVSINGPSATIVNNEVTFEAVIVSVDQVTGISWSFANGNPSSATTESATTSWSAAGTYTVSVTVTNTTGSTTATLNVSVKDWNWGDEISYCGDDEMVSSVGLGGNGELYWGIRVPAAFMANRNYLENAKAFISNAGEYELIIAQSSSDATAPSNVVYQQSYNVNVSSDWYTFDIFGVYNLDVTKDLWVILHTNGVNYPASYSEFCGDYNSSLIMYQNNWYHVQDLSSTLNCTWMIKVTTSETMPPLATVISGPATARDGAQVTFSAAGPSDATYTWTLTGADPSSATGQTVTATYEEAGNYTVSVSVAYQGQTATATHSITIFECTTQSLPYTMGFESTENTACLAFIDNDGDGYNWMSSDDVFGGQVAAHSGTSFYTTASYINGVGELTPDNLMILQRVHIPEGGATITWWEYGVDATYYAEHYSVMASTTGSSANDFTDTIYTGTIASGQTWTQKSATINLNDVDVYIAFRHHNVTDMYMMGIDDISITASSSDASPAVYAANNMGKVTGTAKFEADPKHAAVRDGAKDAPVWLPIRRHFNVTDIDGNTVNSHDILSSGKCILLDYSATWCSWCWVMHENKIMDAIYHQLGSQVEVIWADVDPSTTTAQVRGQGQTQGDWTDGGTCPYPIINDDAVLSLVGESYVTGYPTVVFIAPNPNGTARINDVTNEANVSIYPNPASNMVTVSTEGLQNVEVYDMSGRKVLTSNSSSIDMSQLAGGVYMFRVMTENGTSTMKVIKK